MNIEQRIASQANFEETHLKGALPSCFSAPDTVDHWRHLRMYELALPLLEPDSRWLTIGDGRFGSDAYMLSSIARDAGRGVHVTASSITVATLEEAHARGWIGDFRALNAEAMDLGTGSFDYVFCKETYHHLPRPQVGLYEMLRVAGRAVVLLEPMDHRMRPLDTLKRLVKVRLRGDRSSEFEASGNFIYRVNPPELTKIATALGLPVVAFRTFNDAFVRRFSKHSATRSVGSALTRLMIALQDVLAKLRVLSPGLVSYVLFNEPPMASTRSAMRELGYHFIEIPRNPYLERDTSKAPQTR